MTKEKKFTVDDLPRIKGKVGVIENPAEHSGQWAFSIDIFSLTNEPMGRLLGPVGPFPTEQEAADELKVCIRKACEVYQKEIGVEVTNQYFDMNTQEVRQWEEH